MFCGYEKYLSELDFVLGNCFAEQEPYIFCKKGCCLCCSLGEYPMSRLEFLYLLEGYKLLDLNTQKIIKSRIKKLKKDFFFNSKNGNKSSRFEHKCPFLIGDSCCVYSHRALICRTFGLIKKAKTLDGVEVAILPDCVHKGLNYSNVYNSVERQFDDKKIESVGHKFLPIPYDITLQSLYENCTESNVDFSVRKNMIDFLVEAEL